MYLPGVDIIEISRIKKSIENNGESFIDRVFTSLEVNYCESKKAARYQSYAARFAAKEAVSKVFGTGLSGVNLKEIEIFNDEKGAPKVRFYGETLKKSQELSLVEMEISISHCKEYAVAFVISNKLK